MTWVQYLVVGHAHGTLSTTVTTKGHSVELVCLRNLISVQKPRYWVRTIEFPHEAELRGACGTGLDK